MTTLIAIAVGAVLGAWLRYGLALALNGRGWLPWGTFAANAVGGLLVGLAIAYLAKLTSRILFPPKGGKLPGILMPRHYRARFRPFKYDTRIAKEVLGWKCRSFFESGCDVT